MVPRTSSPCELRKLTTGSICVFEYTVLPIGEDRNKSVWNLLLHPGK